jgi:hypothetical protein
MWTVSCSVTSANIYRTIKCNSRRQLCSYLYRFGPKQFYHSRNEDPTWILKLSYHADQTEFKKTYICMFRNRGSSVGICLTVDWTTGQLRLGPRQRRKDFSSSLCVQTGSGAHPSSCPMSTGGFSQGVKRGRGVTLTTHPHLVPRSWMSRSYSLPPLPLCHHMWVVGLLYLYITFAYTVLQFSTARANTLRDNISNGRGFKINYVGWWTSIGMTWQHFCDLGVNIPQLHVSHRLQIWLFNLFQNVNCKRTAPKSRPRISAHAPSTHFSFSVNGFESALVHINPALPQSL